MQMMQITDMVTLKYFCSSEMPTTNLSNALAKVKGVTDVSVDGRSRTARCKYSGKIKDIVNLEKAAGGAGVVGMVTSHARMVFAFRPLKGNDVAKLKSSVQSLGGVKSSDVSGTAAELYADLAQFSFEDFAKVCSDSGFQGECKSHEQVELAFKAEKYDALEKALDQTRGVLTCRTVGMDKAVMTTVKRIGDDVFKKLCEKSAATFVSVTRK
jgi:copper chaperone CopZ